MKPRPFGRRAPSRRAAPQALVPVAVRGAAASSCLPDTALPSVEDEVAAWKIARGSVVPFPWRQFALMAGLSFGIASFVLPEATNDTMQWPLYALTAISFYVGLRRRETRNDRS